MTITSGDLTFRVHKVIACSACKFFRKALSFPLGKASLCITSCKNNL